MINNIVIAGQVFALNTDTMEVTRTRELGWGYTRAKYFVEKTGKFVFPKEFRFEAIDVEAGDFIVVFETSKDTYNYLKVNLKEAIPYMDALDENRKERRRKEETEDTCVGVDNSDN